MLWKIAALQNLLLSRQIVEPTVEIAFIVGLSLDRVVDDLLNGLHYLRDFFKQAGVSHTRGRASLRFRRMSQGLPAHHARLLNKRYKIGEGQR